MAKTARFTKQMPFVGTDDQFTLMDDTETRLNESKAAVIRTGLTLIYGLVDDVLPAGADVDAVKARAAEIVRRPEDFVVVRRSDLAPESVSALAGRGTDTREDAVLA